jgi:tetratricopeptide (TPR) repeat protein
MFQRALKLKAESRFDEAAEICRAEIACRSDAEVVPYLMLLGSIQRQRKEYDQAIALYRRVLAVKPRTPEALNNVGNIHRDRGDTDRALKCFELAVQEAPENIELLRNLGNAYLDRGRAADAATIFDRILKLSPADSNALNARGIIHRKTGNAPEAIALLERALAASGRDAHTMNNLGNALRDMGRFDEAIAMYRSALAERPSSSTFLGNLAGALQDRGDSAEAERILRALVEADSANYQARFDLSLLLLLTGRLEEGWHHYASRWQASEEAAAARPRFAALAWQGEELDNKALLIHREQGFGDTIQFVRYLPLVRAHLPKAQIYCVLQRPLCRLVSGLARRFNITLIEEGKDLPVFDRWCMLLDLPAIIGTRLDTIPADVPYLAVEKPFMLGWARRLLNLSGLIVGLVWAGSPTNARDAFRSVPLDVMRPLLDVPGVQWVSLQVGANADDIRAARLDANVASWTDSVVDFADTAAIMSGLDLVIGVDTAVMHLAGALGKPAWVLIRQGSEWRWMLDRSDNPWYPTMRLYRQSVRGEWGAVLQEVKRDLIAHVQGLRAKSLRRSGEAVDVAWGASSGLIQN